MSASQGIRGRIPSELHGYCPEFHRDLLDLVACYGHDVRGVEGLRRIDLPTAVPCQVAACVPPSKMAGISVRVRPLDGDASRYAIIVNDDDPRQYVQWDRRVTLADVAQAMAVVDAEMAPTRDPLTGRRRRVASDTYAPPQLRVDDVFKPGAVMVLGKDLDPEDIRLQFDRPDDLAVLDDVDGKGARGLCLKRDKLRRDHLDEVTERVLARYGVHGQEQIDKMPHARLKAMMAEIEEELEKIK